MKNNLIFYALLYFSKEDINPNLKVRSLDKKYNILLKNAYNLANSLKKQKLKFILLTNNLEKISKSKRINFPVKKIKFKKRISSKTPFYTAHYKLDVFKYFEKQKNICCLLDLDVIAINKISKYLMYAKNKKINLVYDLNNQNNEKYNIKIIKTLKMCNNVDYNQPNWYGGEFIFGDNIFFKSINKKIKDILPRYIKNINNVHHIGDETIVNSALQIIKKEKKIKFRDISKNKVITRYWSINTKTKQKKIDYFLNDYFLLHLPADKVFLSKIDVNYMNYKDIRSVYKNHVYSFKNRFINKTKFLINYFKDD